MLLLLHIPAFSLCVFIQKKKNICPPKILYISIHSKLIHNSYVKGKL